MNQKDSQKISYGAQKPQDGLSIVLGSYGQSDKKIKEIIDEVKSLIKLNDFAYCLKAVKKLWQLQAPDVESCKKPQQEYDYHMLKRELHDSLDKYGSVLYGWFADNDGEDAAQLFDQFFPGKKMFSKLYTLCDNLTYEETAKATDLEHYILKAVYRSIESTEVDKSKKLETLKKAIERRKGA